MHKPGSANHAPCDKNLHQNRPVTAPIRAIILPITGGADPKSHSSAYTCASLKSLGHAGKIFIGMQGSNDASPDLDAAQADFMPVNVLIG
jgi:hypothetical protein